MKVIYYIYCIVHFRCAQYKDFSLMPGCLCLWSYMLYSARKPQLEFPPSSPGKSNKKNQLRREGNAVESQIFRTSKGNKTWLEKSGKIPLSFSCNQKLGFVIHIGFCLFTLTLIENKIRRMQSKQNKTKTILWPGSQVCIIERMTSWFTYFTKQIGFVRYVGQNFS